MKNNYLLIAGLVFGLSGAGAMAQTSTTPGVPTPNDHNYPYAQAEQDNQSADQNTYSDQQDQEQDPEAKRHHDRDGNDNYNVDRNDQASANRNDYGNYGDQIQHHLQRRSLNNVSVNDTGSRIVLDGTVNSESQRREAVRIAQAYAHGRQVVDHLQVSDSPYQH